MMEARLKKDYAEVTSVIKWWCDEGGRDQTFKKTTDSLETEDVCTRFENEIKAAEETAKDEGGEKKMPSKR